MYRILLVFTLLLSIITKSGIGQPTAVSMYRYEKSRYALWHDKIDREQKRLMKLDGKDDGMISLSRDETVNLQIEYALIKQVDDLQEKIELDSTLSHNSKIKYLL